MVGVILNPFTAHLYTAIDGEGSFQTVLSPDLSSTLSRTRLPLYQPASLSLKTSVIGVIISSNRSDDIYKTSIKTFENLTSSSGGMVHGLRIHGSAALDLCFVACGFIDGAWQGCQEWDRCAGWVILKEAGGTIVSGEKPLRGSHTVKEPGLSDKMFLYVRAAKSKDETEMWIREFWDLIAD